MNITLLNTKINKFNLFCTISYPLFLLIVYAVYFLRFNLNDDHGIIINASLKVSQGIYPGITESYPHGFLSPLILGFFIKLGSFFDLNWLKAYEFVSIFSYVLLNISLYYLLKSVSDLSKVKLVLISSTITFTCLSVWGGFYHDYLSLIFCLTTISLLKNFFEILKSKNQLNFNDFLLGYFSGFFIVFNPLSTKITSIYFSISALLLISFFTLIEIYFFKNKNLLNNIKFFIYLLIGGISSIIIIAFIVYNLNSNISNFWFNSFSVLKFEEAVNRYSLFEIPFKLFLRIIFIFLFLNINLYISSSLKKRFNSKIFANYLFFFFLFQYIAFWGRSHAWIYMLLLLLAIFSLEKIKLDIKFYKLTKSFLLFSSLIFSYYTAKIINLDTKRSNFLKQRLKLDNTIINSFRIDNLLDYGVTQDSVDASVELKKLFKSGKITNYLSIDDNAFIAPLITGISPIQPLSFYQYQKTIFKDSENTLLNLYKLKPDVLLVCLPQKVPSKEIIHLSKLSNFLRSQDNSQELKDSFFPDFKGNRYFRSNSLRSKKEYLWNKELFIKTIETFKSSYKVIYFNDSCSIYKKI